MKTNNLCIDIEILKDHKAQFRNNQKKLKEMKINMFSPKIHTLKFNFSKSRNKINFCLLEY